MRENYTALWPDLSEVSRETEDVFNSLIENHENAMTELVNIAEEVRQLFLSMTEETPEAEPKSAPLSETAFGGRGYRGIRALFDRTDRAWWGNEGYTQEKLELIMEDTGAAAEDTAETPEEAEKERARRLKPEKLEKKFRELQATEEFQALLESAEKSGAFSASVPPQDQSGISEYWRRRAESSVYRRCTATVHEDDRRKL